MAYGSSTYVDTRTTWSLRYPTDDYDPYGVQYIRFQENHSNTIWISQHLSCLLDPDCSYFQTLFGSVLEYSIHQSMV